MEQFSTYGIVIVLVVIWWSTISLERKVRDIERNTSALLRHFKIDPTHLAPPSEEVKVLAADPARRIDAMRLYRRETGADVRAAKAVVDTLTKAN
jgi:hypothetical protein